MFSGGTSEENQQDLSPGPTSLERAFPGPHRLKTKNSSGPTSFHFVTDGNITPFKCQDIKSLRFLFGSDEKCILLSARLPCTSLPQDTSMSSGLGVKFASP